MIHKIFVFLFFLAFPIIAFANLIWPAYFLEFELLSWWVILAGTFVEFFFVKLLFKKSFAISLSAVVVANLLSTIIGIPLIPIAGMVWGFFPGVIMYSVFGMGGFNPITWFATFLIACLINTFFEGLVYKKFFNTSFSFKSRYFFYFMMANGVSVGMAVIAVFFSDAYN